MKEFRKTKEGLFICEECERTFVYIRGLSKHIRINHNGTKEYHNRWIKEKYEGFCKLCKNETAFINISYGYQKCCSKKCRNIYSSKQTKLGVLKKYGVENVFQSKEIKDKIKKTCLEKYGVENISQSEEIKKKKENTCLKKYGVEYHLSSKIIQQKRKNTNLQKYGVAHPMQNLVSFKKQQSNSFKSHKYKETSLYYRGSYEVDFLEKFYDKYLDLENAPSIKYLFKGKNKIYYPDFYIPSKNLIIEIKNSYLAKKDKEKIEAKEKAVLLKGYKYLIIIDKNYEDFI